MKSVFLSLILSFGLLGQAQAAKCTKSALGNDVCVGSSVVFPQNKLAQPLPIKVRDTYQHPNEQIYVGGIVKSIKGDTLKLEVPGFRESTAHCKRDLWKLLGLNECYPRSKNAKAQAVIPLSSVILVVETPEILSANSHIALSDDEKGLYRGFLTVVLENGLIGLSNVKHIDTTFLLANLLPDESQPLNPHRLGKRVESVQNYKRNDTVTFDMAGKTEKARVQILYSNGLAQVEIAPYYSVLLHIGADGIPRYILTFR